MKNDPKRVPSAGPQPADAVPHVDAISSPCAFDRAVVNGKDHAVALFEGNHFDPGLHPLLKERVGRDEFVDDCEVDGFAPEVREPAPHDGLVRLFLCHGGRPVKWCTKATAPLSQEVSGLP